LRYPLRFLRCLRVPRLRPPIQLFAAFFVLPFVGPFAETLTPFPFARRLRRVPARRLRRVIAILYSIDRFFSSCGFHDDSCDSYAYPCDSYDSWGIHQTYWALRYFHFHYDDSCGFQRGDCDDYDESWPFLTILKS